LINEKRIDVLHSHNYKANLVGLLAAKKANIPIVATLHGYLGTDHKLRIYENIDRFILKFFNKIIFVDNVLRSKINIKKTKFAIIPNGVETNRDIKEYNKEEPKDCIIIGCIGRLSKEKGHKYLIEAFTKLSQNFHNLRLLIVGDGDSRQELENLCIRLHIREKVDFVGFQSDTDKYYSLIDIYASPSLIEHFPMAILEAMSFSKPIVATNVGGRQS
jgi:glycosyltransferase involved in cell wall biosynthesis